MIKSKKALGALKSAITLKRAYLVVVYFRTTVFPAEGKPLKYKK